MDKTELDRQIAVMQAFRDGAEIECRKIILGITPWHSTATPCWDWSAHDYRVKPQKKLRPWKLDEVPLTWLRDAKYGIQQYSINMASIDGIHIISPCKNEFATFSEALKRFEYKRPDGSWHPCGVEVEE